MPNLGASNVGGPSWTVRSALVIGRSVFEVRPMRPLRDDRHLFPRWDDQSGAKRADSQHIAVKLDSPVGHRDCSRVWPTFIVIFARGFKIRQEGSGRIVRVARGWVYFNPSVKIGSKASSYLVRIANG